MNTVTDEELQRTKAIVVAAMAPKPVPLDPVELRGQRDVLARLLGQAIEVVKNVEAEDSTEGDLLRDLIASSEVALAVVASNQALGR